MRFRQGDDAQAALDFLVEGEEGGVDGAAERGGHEEIDGGVVRECGGELGALVAAQGGEVWVVHDVIFWGEVVVALICLLAALAKGRRGCGNLYLRMADDVDDWSHCWW